MTTLITAAKETRKIPDARGFHCFSTVPDFADLGRHEVVDIPIIWDGRGQIGKSEAFLFSRRVTDFCDDRQFSRHIGKVWNGRTTAKSPIIWDFPGI